MAAFSLCLAQHGRLVHTADGTLHNDAGVATKSSGLLADLLGQLSGRGDDERADVVRTRPNVAAASRELWVGLNDSLNSGEEEADGFSGTSPSLGDAVEVQFSFRCP